MGLFTILGGATIIAMAVLMIKRMRPQKIEKIKEE
jgi:hypothetical protein